MYICKENKRYGGNNMARPIKETPILNGKDAERFVSNMYNIKPVSDSYKREMDKAYNKFKKIATFDL